MPKERKLGRYYQTVYFRKRAVQRGRLSRSRGQRVPKPRLRKMAHLFMFVMGWEPTRGKRWDGEAKYSSGWSLGAVKRRVRWGVQKAIKRDLKAT